jgi:hypothetical protein
MLPIKGLTFWACFGRYGGFWIGKRGITLGWVSFKVMPFDIENVLSNYAQKIMETGKEAHHD